MAYTLIDPALMLTVSCRLLGIWGVLNAAQWIVTARHWDNGTALGWDLQGLRASRLYGNRYLAYCFAPRVLRLVAVQQLLAALCLLIASAGWLAFGALIALAASQALLILRAVADGADKMAMVVTGGLLLQVTGDMVGQPLFNFAGTLWIGGQLTLAYATSGIGKLVISGWRTGKVPQQALSSYQFGHRLTHILLHRRTVAIALAWAVILIETLFPIALFAPFYVLLGALGCMALLHLAIAVFVGLNTYPLAFFAAYPSLLLLAQWLHSLDLA